jgi:hypothetical protein
MVMQSYLSYVSGDEVGVHCFKQFHTQLIKDPAYENDPRTAMENAYLRLLTSNRLNHVLYIVAV